MLYYRQSYLLLVLVAVSVFLACRAEGERASTATGATVDVLGIWGGDELMKFESMVRPWEQKTGGKMHFTGTRDITAQLTLRVDGRNPPDIAIPAEVGVFQRFARAGEIVPLSACPGLEEKVRQEYPSSFLDLGTVDGKLYGFFMKADTKATIWYNPKFFREKGYTVPTDTSRFDDLITLSARILAGGTSPWSMGMESGQASGWPGSDWIQQILLNEAGPEVYDGVIRGSVPFTDPRVKAAWEQFGRIALSRGYVAQGSAEGILATNFKDASYPPFQNPPRAAMVALGGFAAGFIKDQFPRLVPGEDYNFFPWPGGAVTGGANIVYAFNSKPGTCSLLDWLATAEAQEIWVRAGGFTAVNTRVKPDAYPDPVARSLARQLTAARVFRFDLDDAIGGAGQQAIFQGVTQYLVNPGNLDRILANIEAARR